MINQELLKEEVKKLVYWVGTHISEDNVRLMKKAYQNESGERGKSMLSSMLDNVEMAEEMELPVCQSPGFPTVYVKFGDKTTPGDVEKFLGEALVNATNEGYFRPSIVDPLTRKNSGNNSGKGVPNIEFEYVKDLDYIEIIISLKGCGAELGNAMKILTVPQLKEDLSGLTELVLDTVIKAGGKPCPPVGIGIGIGGQMDVASKLSRKAISTRKWDDQNEDPLLNELENHLKDEVNKLGLGPAGIGGDNYCLAVKIATAATHTAIAPVAINFHCWVTRRAGIRIYSNGNVEKIL